MTKKAADKNDYRSPIGISYFTCKQQDTFKTLCDDENPEFTFQGTNASILVLIATGKIDARAMAWKQLADMGRDENGKWVGFGKAEKIFQANVTQCMIIGKLNK